MEMFPTPLPACFVSAVDSRKPPLCKGLERLAVFGGADAGEQTAEFPRIFMSVEEL